MSDDSNEFDCRNQIPAQPRHHYTALQWCLVLGPIAISQPASTALVTTQFTVGCQEGWIDVGCYTLLTFHRYFSVLQIINSYIVTQL